MTAKASVGVAGYAKNTKSVKRNHWYALPEMGHELPTCAKQREGVK